MIRNIRLLAFAATVLAGSTVAASASFTLEGDAGAMTLVADGGSRSEIVAAITKKFAIETIGSAVDDGAINGRFSGTLGHVLKSILPRNGYAIAYSEGRPVRVTFTGLGVPSAPVPAAMAQGTTQTPVIAGTTAATAPVARAVPGSLEQRAVQRLTAVPNAEPKPQNSGKEQDMQQQVAEATARALVQLKALTADLNKNNGL